MDQKKTTKKKKKAAIVAYWPYALYALVVLAVMYPLYRPGFLFLLDMSFAPWIDLADVFAGVVPHYAPLVLLMKLFSFVVSTAVIQKIMLTLLLFLSGAFMYKLVSQKSKIKNQHFGTSEKRTFNVNIYAVLAGLIYMINPWVYERFLAGHWLVLLGYAVLPLYVLLLLNVCSETLDQNQHTGVLKYAPTKTAWRFLALFAIYPMLSPHFAYIALFVGLVVFIVFLAKHYKKLAKKWYKHVAKTALIAAVLVLIVNSFWLFAPKSLLDTYYTFTINDFEAFQTIGDSQYGIVLNALSLYGYWNTDYFLPKDAFDYWWIIPIVLVVLSMIGGVYAWRRKNIIGMTATTIFLPALILGIGWGYEPFRPIISFLYDWLPGFKGLRETGKLLGVVIFSYAILVPLGVFRIGKMLSRLQSHLPKKVTNSIPIALTVLLAIAMTHSIFFGFAMQVKPSDYPSDWYEVNDLLAADPETRTVMFLPWHGYMAFSFTNHKVISNPAQKFFSFPVVASKNIDNVYLLETRQAEWDDLIFRVIHGLQTLDENIPYLKSKNISHIILARELDWERYEFLNNSKRIEKIFDEADLIIYRVQ